mgnify:FL=1
MWERVIMKGCRAEARVRLCPAQVKALHSDPVMYVG